MLKIIVESHIPFIKGRLEPWADVEYLEPAAFTSATVRDADAIVVRTRTRCSQALLEGSRVGFVGTATIGTDHIDLAYCASHGIAVANAPGCNAPAVAQWVLSTVGHWMRARGIADPGKLTLGVVGVGHVGSIVARWARELGLNVLLCDPPRAEAEGSEGFCSYGRLVSQSNVITYHVPLTTRGPYATRHLCDEQMLDRAECCGLIMNASRGRVCDNSLLEHWHGDVAIDCWENEPDINLGLLNRAFVATPHIAGYSIEGKMRGTAMVVNALNAHFGINAEAPGVEVPAEGPRDVTFSSVMHSYNPLADTERLRLSPATFEIQRQNYDLRHEVR